MRLWRVAKFGLPWLLVLLLWVAPAHAGDKGIGYVVRVKGHADIVNQKAGTSSPAKAQQMLHLGEVVVTGEGSVVELRLADDSLVQVGPSSRVALAQFHYDPKGQTRSTRLDMPVGRVQALVNDLFGFSQRKFEVKTQNAIAGVRGTLLMVLAPTPVKTEVISYDHPVEVYNPAEPANKVVVQRLTSTTITGAKGKPTPPAPVTPAQFQSIQRESGFSPAPTQGGSDSGAGTTAATTAASSGTTATSSSGAAIGVVSQAASTVSTTGTTTAPGLNKTTVSATPTAPGNGQGRALGLLKKSGTPSAAGLEAGLPPGSSPPGGGAPGKSPGGAAPSSAKAGGKTFTPPGQGGVAPGQVAGGSSLPGNSGSAPGQTGTSSPGNSGSAPGQTGTSSPGNSGSAPGQTGTSSPGNSGSAPGQTTSPGNSGSAPGQTGNTPGNSGKTPPGQDKDKKK